MESEDNIPKKKSLLLIICITIITALVLFLGISIPLMYLTIKQQIKSMQNFMHVLEQRQVNDRHSISIQDAVCKQKLDEQNLAIDKLHQQISTQKHNKVLSSGVEIFLTNKARSLLEIAQINAYWTDDTSTTIKLLDQADQILAETKDPKMQAIRDSVALARAQQLKTQTTDLVKIISELAADQTFIDTLSVNKSPAIKSNKSLVHNSLHAAWNMLQELVILRHHDKFTPVTLTFTDVTYMRAALYLDLENAKWAVLHNQPEIFRLSIQDALTIINRGFENKSSAQLKQRLIKLEQTKLNIKTPITQDFNFGESA